MLRLFEFARVGEAAGAGEWPRVQIRSQCNRPLCHHSLAGGNSAARLHSEAGRRTDCGATWCGEGDEVVVDGGDEGWKVARVERRHGRGGVGRDAKNREMAAVLQACARLLISRAVVEWPLSRCKPPRPRGRRISAPFIPSSRGCSRCVGLREALELREGRRCK